jgi:hypothetical protein
MLKTEANGGSPTSADNELEVNEGAGKVPDSASIDLEG